MINRNKLVEMVKKWHKRATIGRRRISMLRSGDEVQQESRRKPVADKGHFVVYSADGKRFVIPLAFLKSPIFIELSRMSKDEFGLPCGGPITMPCNAVFMDLIISSIQRNSSQKVGKDLLTSIANHRCSTSSMLHQGQTKLQILIH
ncbi:hypothetical protein MRB53_014465 [Persea americana]|uniref:Uncharacterized protein n=1 Tax=Persea americana TaxID=3435 RepID=A0ACC2KAW5_PERAE|nr:hypothetical protein MRB53_014465 [Persea americana]